MERFKKLTSGCVPLKNENVDTDQIIPARFLTSILKTGFGENLFRDWRYDSKGQEKKDFILNKPEYKKHTILIAGQNFGCGSSREHAAWAIQQYGFKAVISSQFGDIFKMNSFKNGLLVIDVKDRELSDIFREIEKDPNFKITIDLKNQIVSTSHEKDIKFDIDQFRKHCLLEGLDDLGYMVSKEKAIVTHEKKYSK